MRSAALTLALVAAVLPAAAFAQAVPETQTARPTNEPLTLEAAIAQAMEQNPDLIKQRLLARSSESDLQSSRSAIYPNVNFNASLGVTRIGGGEALPPIVTPDLKDPVCVADITDPNCRKLVIQQTNPSQTFGNYAIGLSLRQLIYDGGKWWNNITAADKTLAASRENIEEQKLTTVFSVRQRFYELVRAQRTLAVLGEAGKRSRDQADWAQKLYEGGRATQADVYAARANRDQDEVNRLQQEAAIEIARQDLAIAIGRDPAAPLAVVDPPDLSQDPSAPPAADEAVNRALAQRPSLKAFALQLEALRKLADVAKGDYWPVITANGSYQRGTRNLSDFTLSPEKANTLSGSVNLTWGLTNFIDGYSISSNVKKAELQVAITANDLQSGRRSVASDVERAVASWTSARTRALVTRQLEENSVKNLELARARQQVGVGTQLEVRDAELKVTQAKLSRVGALVDSREAAAALQRATGDI